MRQSNTQSLAVLIKTSHMEDLLKFLNEKNIISRPFWMPMSELPVFKMLINFDDICSDIHKLASIPCSTNISQKVRKFVVLARFL